MLMLLNILWAAASVDLSAFRYDAGAPLNLTRHLLWERQGVRLYDAVYDSPRGGKVTAFVVAPARAGRHAGLVFGHWGPGNRTEFLAEATLMARLGVVSVLVDYPWTRPAPWHADADDIMEPARAVQLHEQAVVDLRRAIDLLLAWPGVEPARLAYVGHSYGAQFGSILAAVDKRLKGVVLMGGVPDMDAILGEGTSVGIKKFVEKNQQHIPAALAKLRATAAVEFVPQAAPVPLLFQFARHERDFGVSAMERFFQAASEPKSLRWYETGHELNHPQAFADRARWLAVRLRLAGTEKLLKNLATAP